MTKIFIDSNGGQHEFTDNFTPDEMMSAVDSYEKQNQAKPKPGFLSPESRQLLTKNTANNRPWYELNQGKPYTEEERQKLTKADTQTLPDILSTMLPVGNAARLLPKAGALVKGAANIAGRVGQAAGYGALTSGQNDSATSGLVSGAIQSGLEAGFPAFRGLSYLAAHGLSKFAPEAGQAAKKFIGNPLDELKKTIQNQILHTINKKSQVPGGTRTPEEAKQIMQERYTTQEGKPMPVDIGTLADERVTKNLHGATGYLPFTGTAQAQKSIEQEQATNEIAELRKQLGISSEKNKNENKNNQDVAQQLKSERVKDAQKKEDRLHAKLARQIEEHQQKVNSINQQNQDKIAETEAERKSILAKKVPHEQAIETHTNEYNQKSERQQQAEENARLLREHIEQAPEKLQAMHDERLVRSQQEDATPFTLATIPEMHKHDVKMQYDNTYKQAKNIYAPLNNSNESVEIIPHKDFKEYRNDLKDLNHEGERIYNAIGSDLAPSVKSMVAAGLKFTDHAYPYTVKIKDMVSHMQSLGKAAAKLKDAGENKAAATISALDHAMHNGFIEAMKSRGLDHLADSYVNATKFFKQNVVPYWNNSVIREAATTKLTPKENKLANALHETEHQKILHSLPLDTQKSMGAEVIGKKKGTSKGEVNQSPEEIAKNYATGLSKYEKRAIAKYAPEQDEYFESLKRAINERKNAESESEKIQTQLGRHESKISQHEKKVSDILNAHNAVESPKLTEIPASHHIETTKQRLEDAQEKKNRLINKPYTPRPFESNLVEKLKAAEEKRKGIETQSGLIGHLKTGGKVGGVIGAALLAPKVAIGSALGGIPLARLLRDPALIQAYINKQPLTMKQALLKKLTEGLTERLPRLSAISGANLSNNGEQ